MRLLARYIWNNVQAFDRQLNALFGGTDKEYMSSRVYRYKDTNKVAYVAYRVLNWIEKDHCEQAYADAQEGFNPNDAVWK